MKKIIAIMAIGFSSLVSSTTLQAMILSIDKGSSWCFDVSWGCADLPVAMTGHDGIRTGEIQTAGGSHAGPPDGTENPGIDKPWNFYGQTGMHLTNSPVTVLTQNTNTMTLDFSGWGITWNNIAFMPLGTGAWYGGNNGIAEVTCAVDCSNGDTYVLSYSATVPLGDLSGFGGTRYGLYTNGTISAIPLPAAFWLFGSGLVALLYRVRRR